MKIKLKVLNNLNFKAAKSVDKSFKYNPKQLPRG